MSSTNVVSPSTVEPSRSRITIRHVQFLLVILALLVTGYMTYTKLAGESLQCAEVGMINCSVVENSAWARVLGIPTAMLGFTAHLIILALLVLETRTEFGRSWGVPALLGVTLFSVLYHSYLIYISVFVLKALCPWCLTAASIMFVQFILTAVRFRRWLAT